MKFGTDGDGDAWCVDGRMIKINERERLYFSRVRQALEFAAAVCEEAGEEGLAERIWEKIREKGMMP